MLDGLQTAGLVIAVFIVGSIISYLVYKRELQYALQSIADILTEIFEKPLVKGSMSVLGKKSGEVRTNTAIVDRMAGDVLNSERFSGIKTAANLAGIDIDGYIEEYGAQNVIAAAKQIGGLLGIDITKGSQDILGNASSSSTQTQYPG